MKGIIFGALLIATFGLSGRAMAQELCETLSECQQLEKQVKERIRELQGHLSVTIGDFLRISDGQVRNRINQYQAERACAEQGSRLPTARELAEEATRYGAEILELSQAPTGKVPEGYYRINAKNPNGTTDSFYYSRQNYKRPSGDLGNYWVWSSSLHPVFDDVAFDFYGADGFLYYYSRGTRFGYDSARCVSVGGVE